MVSFKRLLCYIKVDYFFFCPLVSSWLRTDAARDFFSAEVRFVFCPDKTFDASVDTLLDDCFLAIFYLHAKRVKDRGANSCAPDICLCVHVKTERFFAVCRRE